MKSGSGRLLLSANQVAYGFSHRTLFEGLTFSIFEGEHIALIGQNGAGKSTLLKILTGQIHPDSGDVVTNKGLSLSYLSQTPEFNPEQTVKDYVYEGILESEDWEKTRYAEEALSRLGFRDSKTPYEMKLLKELSGGWQKKAALAKLLAQNSDLVLLDEPTNHLDIDAILWLEEFIRKSRKTFLIISHDRSFLRKTADRVIEIDRRNPGGILSADGSLDEFFQVKETYLEQLAAREASLANTLRRETEWLKRGAKARTTKQKARIDRAVELGSEVSKLKELNQSQSLDLQFDGDGRSPKKLIELKNIEHGYGDQTLLAHLNFLFTGKTRLGVIGNNGVGKSTLIKLIVGEEKPRSGEIFRSDLTEFNYFEQSRETLDPDISVLKTVCPFGETVEFFGRKIHVRSYLDRFLFSGPDVDKLVGKLSGGERARLLLARMMLKKANFLILDEPTNDLDLQTLAVLEECLEDFPGAILLVSHDRDFMDAVCSQILSLPDQTLYSSIDQWEDAKKRLNPNKKSNKAETTTSARNDVQTAPKAPQKKRLSYMEQREWDQMEGRVVELEASLKLKQKELDRPEILSNSARLLEATREVSELEEELEKLMNRWAELEAKQN